MTSNAAAAQPRIFVSVVSYRDSQTIPTLRSLVNAAACPHRLSFGIVWQYKHGDDDTFMVLPPPQSLRGATVRQLKIPHSDARGPMLARSLAESLLDGEEFYLQLDSHMRATRGWDNKLIEQYCQCISHGDTKPVISAYPANYDVDIASGSDSDGDCEEFSECVNAMTAQRFDDDGFLRIVGNPIGPPPPSRSPQSSSPSLDVAPFVAAGFLFGARSIVRDCPHSQSFPFVFFGEELLLSMRLFTFGYTFYLPQSPIMRHAWSRSHRPTFHELFLSDGRNKELQAESKEKLKSLLYNNSTSTHTDSGNDSDCGLFGTVHSCEMFWASRGIDPRARFISESARLGGLTSDRFQPPVTAGSPSPSLSVIDANIRSKIQQFLPF